jgi:ELWxxDGT repeat protein
MFAGIGSSGHVELMAYKDEPGHDIPCTLTSILRRDNPWRNSTSATAHSALAAWSTHSDVVWGGDGQLYFVAQPHSDSGLRLPRDCIHGDNGLRVCVGDLVRPDADRPGESACIETLSTNSATVTYFDGRAGYAIDVGMLSAAAHREPDSRFVWESCSMQCGCDKVVHNAEAPKQLWTFDGLEARPAANGSVVSMPSHPDADGETNGHGLLARLGDKLYFVNRDGAHGEELWAYDYDTDHAYLAEDTCPGEEGGAPRTLTPLAYYDESGAERGMLIFSGAGCGVNEAGILGAGRELWGFDGSNASLLADINDRQLGASSNPARFTTFDSMVVFVADDGVHGTELWAYRPCASGRVQCGAWLLADLAPGNASSNPHGMAEFHGKLFFTAREHGDIWTLDDVGAINLMLAINSQFHDPIAGIDLTRTRPGVAYNESQGRSHFFVPAGDALFFAAYDDIDGNEPWLYHISEHRWITYTDLEDRAPPGYSGTSCSDWNATHPHTMPNLIGSVNHIYRADDCMSLCDALLTCTHVQLRYRQTTGANHDMSYDRVANQRLECWLLSGDYSTTGMDIHIESAGHWSGFEAADGGDGTTHSRPLSLHLSAAQRGVGGGFFDYCFGKTSIFRAADICPGTCNSLHGAVAMDEAVEAGELAEGSASHKLGKRELYLGKLGAHDGLGRLVVAANDDAVGVEPWVVYVGDTLGATASPSPEPSPSPQPSAPAADQFAAAARLADLNTDNYESVPETIDYMASSDPRSFTAIDGLVYFFARVSSHNTKNFERDATWPGTYTRGRKWADRDLFVWDPRKPAGWNSMSLQHGESTSNPRRIFNRAEDAHTTAYLSHGEVQVQTASVDASDDPFNYYYSYDSPQSRAPFRSYVPWTIESPLLLLIPAGAFPAAVTAPRTERRRLEEAWVATAVARMAPSPMTSPPVSSPAMMSAARPAAAAASPSSAAHSSVLPSFPVASRVRTPHPTSSTLPTVSVLMPTNGRPEFVRHALASIGRQDYPAELVEVVIVDDSPAALRVDGLAAGAQRVGNVSVVYVVLSEQRSIGAKRNEAVRRATGEVAVHWDDDDIFAEGRLRAQVAPIVRGEADVTLLEHQLTYFMDRDELYAAAMPWKEDVSTWGPHFGTLSYRRSLVVGGVEFPDASEAEDYGFAQRVVEAGARLLVLAPPHASRATRTSCPTHAGC